LHTMGGITYHSNARTTIQIRGDIQKSNESMESLAQRYNLCKSTILKWKHRDELTDKSCRPKRLRTVLSELDEWIICEVRKTALINIDDLSELLRPFIPAVNRYNIYRCLKRHGMEQLDKMTTSKENSKLAHKEFKIYEPGYVHVDIKVMPKLKGEPEKKYLFVSIDRATRLVYVSLKDNKDAKSAKEFLDELIRFYPYRIEKVLTDNGKEFTDRFCRNRKEASGNHIFDKGCTVHEIQHRLTKPYTPQTNGMVERFNGRIEEILDKNKFNNYNHLIVALEGYVKCYNYFNKQKVLGYKAPVEIVKEWYEKKRELFKDEVDMLTYNVSQPDR